MQVKPSARYCCSFEKGNLDSLSMFLYFKLLFYTHNRSKDTSHFFTQNLFQNVQTVREKEANWGGWLPVHCCSPFPLEFLSHNTYMGEHTFSLYYRILIQGDKTHPLIFIVGTINFIEYLQRYQILIFIYLLYTN